MSYEEPGLRLTVQGLRFMGEDWEPVGTSGTFDLMGTDTEEPAGEVLRALRAILAARLGISIPMLGVAFNDLDFTAPNAPTEHDMDHLLQQAERIVKHLRALRELSPEVLPADDEFEDE